MAFFLVIIWRVVRAIWWHFGAMWRHFGAKLGATACQNGGFAILRWSRGERGEEGEYHR